ncbi:MAG: FHA domain-containing protein [Planctomycetota bacterium]|jgi:pSer/pThr/pTyr-binding forkhead associated (FHA) protein
MDVKLVFFKPNGRRKDFSVTNSVTLVGRGEDCDLQVPLANISRKHCKIRLGGDGLSVDDLESSNGTFVNNQRVISSPLKAGDRLVVGPVVFTVQIDGTPEEIKPVKTRGQVAGEAGQDQGEPVVDLEADFIGREGDLPEDEADALAVSATAAEDEIDPIEALEALAAESDKEEPEEEEEGKEQ